MANLTCPSTDINFLAPNGFKLSITKLPELEYFSIGANLPGLSLGDPQFNNPLSRQPIPGDQLQYDMFNVTFIVDSKMDNFVAVHDWMVALGFPQDYRQYQELVGDRAKGRTELSSNYSDGSLIILGPNNTKVREISIVDMFPTELSGLNFNTTVNDVEYITSTATFAFGYYIIR